MRPMQVVLRLLGGHDVRGGHHLDEARIELARSARHLEPLDVPGLGIGIGIGLDPGLGRLDRLAGIGQLVDHLHRQRLGRAEILPWSMYISAIWTPMRRGRRCVPPPPGKSPISTSGRPTATLGPFESTR